MRIHPISVLLVSAPWESFGLPCTPLCSLASYGQALGHDVETLHACQKLRFKLRASFHDELSESKGEAIAASLLFPERQSKILRNMRRHFSRISELRRLVHDAYRNIFEEIPWSRYKLLTFWITHGNMYFSLLMAKWVREDRKKSIHITLGGPRVLDQLGQILLKRFPQIDSVIDGEAELSLAGLIEQLSGNKRVDWTAVPGISYRQEMGISKNPQQLANLDTLPTPYFDEYVRNHAKQSSKLRTPLSLTLEASRGCYNRCAFCTDTVWVHSYRAKAPSKVVHDLKALVTRYGVFDFIMVDRVTPKLEWWQSFQRILQRHRTLPSISLFAEVRPTVTRRQLAIMKQCGVNRIQIGCESLSQNVLRRMNKRSLVIENLNAMKQAEELGLPYHTFFMTRFPTESQADVNECTRNIDYAISYRPFVRVSRFYLEYGSAVHRAPHLFNVTRIIPRDTVGFYRALPSFLLKRYGTITYAFKRKGTVDYRALISAYRRWRKCYDRERAKGRWLLTYEDFGSSGIVYDRRSGKRKLLQLDFMQNQIVRTCDEVKRYGFLEKHLEDFSCTKFQLAIDRLVQLGIIFCEGQWYLSLPLNIEQLRQNRGHR